MYKNLIMCKSWLNLDLSTIQSNAGEPSCELWSSLQRSKLVVFHKSRVISLIVCSYFINTNIVFNLKSEKVKNWRTYFTFSGLATGLVLGLLPSLWDSVSDFLFAKEEEKSPSIDEISWGGDSFTNPSASALLTYFFISLPLNWTASFKLHRMMLTQLFATKRCSRWNQYRVCRGTAN